MEELASRKTAGERNKPVSIGTQGGAILVGDVRKNTATLSSETILTARLGCLARTLAASSCTESEIAILRAMSTSSAAKDTSPDSAAVGLDTCLPNHPLARSSLVVSLNVRGMAVNTIESMSTDAMSSSSDSCASRAASSSSRPMPKETENARSEPKLPSALSAMAPVVDAHLGGEVVHFALVDAALRESHYLPARLAWQAPSAGGALLVLRRLLVAPRSTGRSGGPLRTEHRRGVNETQHCSDGTVYGCTMGNLMQHCRNPVNKRPLKTSMALLRKVLLGASRALGRTTGPDVEHLVRGMACHRVLKAQGKRLRELRKAPAIDSKTGHVGQVVGAALSVLVAFECMAEHKPDRAGLGAQLGASLRDAHGAVSRWRLPDVYDDCMREAMRAESRALERAQLAVARAQLVGKKLPECEAVRLQLDCYRRAVWPAGEELSCESHAQVCQRISSGELVDLEPSVTGLHGHAAPGVSGLEALLGRARSSSSDDDSASRSASNSSWGSFSSYSSTESEAAGQHSWPDYERLALAMHGALLSADARSAVALPSTISSTPVPGCVRY